MAWRRLGAKPLSEPMLIYLTDAYVRHLASPSFKLNGEKYQYDSPDKPPPGNNG